MDLARWLSLQNSGHCTASVCAMDVMSVGTTTVRCFSTVWAYVDLLRSRWWVEADRAFATQSEHEAIADALLKRNPILARERNETHVDNAWRVVEAGLKGLEEQPKAAING